MINFPGALCRQFTSGFIVSLSCLEVAMSISWLGLTEQILRSQDSPVGPLSDSEISWLGSLPGLGAIFGALFWSRIIKKIGRKYAAILTTIPMVISQLMYIFARSYYILLISRFLSGIGMIGAMLNTPGYIAEICEMKIKSNAASFVMLLVNMGNVFMFSVGFFFKYFYFNIVIAIIPVIVAMLIFLLVPESPVHFIKVGQDEKAKEQLKWLRASQDTNYIDAEFNKLKETFVNASECTKSLTFSEIWHSSYYLKSLLMGLVLQSSIFMTGLGVVGTYTKSILKIALDVKETADDEQIGWYALLLGASTFLGSLIGSLIFNKFNRKVVLIGCHLTVTLCFFFVAVSLYLRSEYGVSINPVTCVFPFFVYVIVQGIGIGNGVYVIISELFAAECRNIFTAALLFLHFSLHFIVAKLYPVLLGTIHLYGWLFIFGSYSLWMSIFGYFILPETKGRTIQQLFNKLSKNMPHVRSHTKTEKQISMIS